MRFLTFVAAALLPLTALAAKKTPAEKFEAAWAKQVASGPAKLTDISYESLTKGPRDHSVAVLLTALDARFSCQLCKDFQPEWDLVARSWTKGDKVAESKLLFGTLDFLDGKSVFQALQLQSAPVILLFKPTTGPHADNNNNPERFDFGGGNINKAEPVRDWIARGLPNRPHPPVVRPVNYTKVAIIASAVLGFVTFGATAGHLILPIIQNRNLWAAISLIAVLLFTSGYMFNQIRKTPYVAGDGKGGISYFAGGFQNQFGAETQIVAAMYGVLAFATISLALKVPRMTDPRAQQIAVIAWAGIILGMYSFLISIFRIKNAGYPFWLPPF